MKAQELLTYVEELVFKTSMFGYDKDEVDIQLDKICDEIEAIESGLRDDKATNLQTYKREILETLNNAVLLRYCYADGVTEHSLEEDAEVHRAVDLLNNPEEYHHILREVDTVRK